MEDKIRETKLLESWIERTIELDEEFINYRRSIDRNRNSFFIEDQPIETGLHLS